MDGGAFQASGAILSNLSVGSHTIKFGAASGWLPPSNQLVAISSGLTTTAFGRYATAPQFAAVQVTLLPASVTTAGAQWDVEGPNYNSGDTLTLPAGTYTISFVPISGWQAPSIQVVTVSGGTKQQLRETYTLQNHSPELAIGSPRAGQSLTNSVLMVSGTAASGSGIAAVFCELNSGGWLPAASTNGFTNWMASVFPVPGSNSLSAFALDTRGNFSATNSVAFDDIPAGTYVGLFAPTNAPRQLGNSGAITFTVSATGLISGKLLMGTNTITFSGTFNPSGAAMITTPVGFTMRLDFSGQSVQGTVGNRHG